MTSSLLISTNNQLFQTPFLTFVTDQQIPEVTVQARTKWKIKQQQQKTPQEEKKRAKKKKEKKNYTKNQNVKGNGKSGRS